MLNEHDINDWEMITTPLKLEQLKEGDVFSVLGDNKMYKLYCVLTDIALAGTEEIWDSLVFPRTMNVFKWVKNNA
jgi:hypothetical protein